MTTSRDLRYEIALEWEGNLGAGTTAYTAYGRQFRVAVDGKPDLRGSADPLFRGDSALHNPEELLLAAIAACHMLTYLALCARAGIAVLAYSDEATATLELLPAGGGGVTQATLRPRVRLASGADREAAAELHARAGEQCYLARSVRFPVHHEPTIVIPEVVEATP